MNKNYTLLLLLIAITTYSFANNHSINRKDITYNKAIELKQKAFALMPTNKNLLNLKSASATKQMLDNISYPDGSYKAYAYNEGGQIIDYKFYEYESWDETIELKEQIQIEYDANGNQTLFVDKYLDSFDGFIVKFKEESSYQDNNIPLEEISWEFNDTEKILQKTAKTAYEVIDATHLIVYGYGWYDTNDEWLLSRKDEIKYSDFEHPLLVKSYEYDRGSDTYYIVAELEFTYNANGMETEMISKYVSEETGELVLASTITTSYNEDGNITNRAEKGPYMGEEIVAYEQVYTYENKLLIKEEYNGAFGSYFSEYSYSDGKLSESKDFYEEYNDDWESIGFSMQYKDQFFYNSITIDDLVYPINLETYYSSFSDFIDPFYFNNGALDYTICSSWDYVTETVAEKYRGIYNYSDFKAGIQETGVNGPLKAALKLGPNPCSETLNISLSEKESALISIFNTEGKTIHQATVNGNYSINTTNWKNGIYFILSNSHTYKILKH
ncbi:MAG: T9SS type A sorting domain-containing protein [Prolixibacteraceae bacterium]|jgi:hypothetical protein|nr:T9SS type A sorting domain-containing protein [Prolixibacteraceae bacterium]